MLLSRVYLGQTPLVKQPLFLKPSRYAFFSQIKKEWNDLAKSQYYGIFWLGVGRNGEDFFCNLKRCMIRA